MDDPRDIATTELHKAGFFTADENGALIIQTYDPTEMKKARKILKAAGYNRSYGFRPQR